MLGFSPISARPISGSPFSLVAVAAAMSATLTVTLGVSGRIGIVTPMSATIGITFPVSAFLRVNQALSASMSMTFGLSGFLTVAGKPIRINALPESFEVRALKENWTLKALPQSFSVRGVR